MTALERELKKSLKRQEELFLKELENATRFYEDNLMRITESYNKQINKAVSLLEKQEKALQGFELLSNEVKISLDEKLLTSLQTQIDTLIYWLRKMITTEKDLSAELKKKY